jgi:hypothetical protein
LLATILTDTKDCENVDSDNNEQWFEADYTNPGYEELTNKGQTTETDGRKDEETALITEIKSAIQPLGSGMTNYFRLFGAW